MSTATDRLCIIPVRAVDALSWVEGKLCDRDLLLHAPLKPEAVFVVNLPDLRSYRQALRTVAYWRDRGAVCMIFRTGTPALEDHVLKNGAQALCYETGAPMKTRYIMLPDAFSRWLAKFTKNDAHS